MYYAKVLLKNNLKEFVWIGMNLFAICILLHHYYCKGNIKSIQNRYSFVLQHFYLFFEMSSYLAQVYLAKVC